MNENRLLASFWTLAGDVSPLDGSAISVNSLESRAAAAHKAGFVGLGLSIDDAKYNIEKYGKRTVRSLLRNYGIQHIELEPLFDWFVDGEQRAASDKVRETTWQLAEDLGAFQLKIGGDFSGADWPVERVTDEFATLCGQASDVGLSVVIELIVESSISDLPTAVKIIQGAGCDNGGLLLDIWQVARAGVSYKDIRNLPEGVIKHIEFCDALKQQQGSWLEDTVCHRLPPGAGELDIGAFLTRFRALSIRD
ncbi:sugar phosphate isomerase/epimerase family protein [Kineobactrum salinum]|uniref:Sugar phosphate isomerase/epimerase n=1 Tax=Kineobactrum salinum TaxID=2708301 RepID=A0A6C0U0R5_9GAMM|nr:TIM barrel protein [Kineobactrum salinum]QIB65621.1 sugar phosphate isomerase/epimerase [Kineobactrum salinum]